MVLSLAFAFSCFQGCVSTMDEYFDEDVFAEEEEERSEKRNERENGDDNAEQNYEDDLAKSSETEEEVSVLQEGDYALDGNRGEYEKRDDYVEDESERSEESEEVAQERVESEANQPVVENRQPAASQTRSRKIVVYTLRNGTPIYAKPNGVVRRTLRRGTNVLVEVKGQWVKSSRGWLKASDVTYSGISDRINRAQAWLGGHPSYRRRHKSPTVSNGNQRAIAQHNRRKH